MQDEFAARVEGQFSDMVEHAAGIAAVVAG